MEEELSAYVDGEAETARTAEIAGHVEQCDRCAASVREFAAVTRAFRRHGSKGPGAAAGATIRSRLRLMS